MNILCYHDGLVDLDGPIHMSLEQRKPFVEFFNRLLGKDVETSGRSEIGREVGTPGAARRRWAPAELQLLLTGTSNETVAEELGRSEMSVRMKRGEFPPAFLGWLKGRGKVLPGGLEDRHRLIQVYLVEGE